MLFEQNIKNKHLKFFITLCLLSITSQVFAGHLLTKNNHHQKRLTVIYEQGQFLIIPAQEIVSTTKASKIASQSLEIIKTDSHNSVKAPQANNTQISHIYLSINISNKEKP